MRKHLLGSVTGALALAISATAVAGSRKPIDLADFKVGVSTSAEIIGKLGKPNTVEQSSDGHKTLTYSSSRTHVKGATFVPIVGLFAGGATGDVTWDRFEFGSDGVLIKAATSDTHVDCKTLGGCN